MNIPKVAQGLAAWLWVCLILFSQALVAQELSKTELEERAAEYFNRGDYILSAADYAVLHEMYPRENEYAYFLGRASLDANVELTQAIELLKNCAIRNYGDDTYFHLGRAYHRNYQFDEARHAMMTFSKTAKKKVLRDYDVEYWLKVIENARKSVLVAQQLDVDDMQEVPSKSLESAYIDKLNGKFVFVPDEFMTREAEKQNYQSLMFISESISVGDYLYFASVSNSSRRGKDIYRVRRLTAGDYSLPELLPAVINTEYNEEYPYFDASLSQLYFSSNNPETMGGYDIFRIEYQEEDDSWGKPEKLNFPINSVHDDILYTSLDSDTEALFLSARNSSYPDLHAYTIQLDTNVPYRIPAAREEVLELALLAPASISISEEDFRIAQVAPYESAEEEVSGMTEYERLLNKALGYQMRSDSLAWMAEEMKHRAAASEDLREKQSRIGNITALEAEALRLEELADKTFEEAERARQSAGTDQIDEGVLSKSMTTSGGITLYSYRSGEEPAETAGGEDSPNALNASLAGAGVAAGSSAGELLSMGFSIGQQSPYSEANPIPENKVPPGLVYRIQLGAFQNDIPENTFGGLSPLSREQVGASTKYYVGYFKSIKDAREALKDVKGYGYPDAFIVSYYQSEKISIQKAREIEFAGKTF